MVCWYPHILEVVSCRLLFGASHAKMHSVCQFASWSIPEKQQVIE
uniref:Uncharacterized protein n=1 Tax=Arundo donax TaxID=35708 RepID=A0A0A9CFI3_ARUDO